jgi:hypothetical protein
MNKVTGLFGILGELNGEIKDIYIFQLGIAVGLLIWVSYLILSIIILGLGMAPPI